MPTVLFKYADGHEEKHEVADPLPERLERQHPNPGMVHIALGNGHAVAFVRMNFTDGEPLYVEKWEAVSQSSVVAVVDRTRQQFVELAGRHGFAEANLYAMFNPDSFAILFDWKNGAGSCRIWSNWITREYLRLHWMAAVANVLERMHLQLMGVIMSSERDNALVRVAILPDAGTSPSHPSPSAGKTN